MAKKHAVKSVEPTDHHLRWKGTCECGVYEIGGTEYVATQIIERHVRQWNDNNW